MIGINSGPLMWVLKAVGVWLLADGLVTFLAPRRGRPEEWGWTLNTIRVLRIALGIFFILIS